LSGFSFPAETFAFITGIAAHNDKLWFDANRPLYEAGYVAAGKAFVEAIGPRFRAISPEVKFEPRINGSLSRINRDIRFTKDKRPYKEHLGLWFWHGEKRSWDRVGFWFSVNATRIEGGVGIYRFTPEQLESYRQSAIHPRSGKALAALMSELASAGYSVEGKTRKRQPKGYEIDPDRADLLLYEGLYAGFELPLDAGREADLIDRLVPLYAGVWPVGKWLIDEGVD
jgi:uncharacterized protein (TIGR02453 family)